MDKPLSKSIFRAYDIRGIAGSELTNEHIFNIGKALGSFTLEKSQTALIIGRDGRLTSPELSEHFVRGVIASGCDVIDIGIVPTPLVYFSTFKLNTQSGAIVTGSHNPPEYNGIKMVVAGKVLSANEIKDLYHRILNNDYLTGSGNYSKHDIINTYIDYIVNSVHLPKKLKVVVDCGNGTAGITAPLLYQKLGCDVISLFEEVDGRFPHHHPDPGNPHNLQILIQAVKTHEADIGLAFDGDADRIGVVTNAGEIIWPDKQLILYALHLLKTHPGASFVFDVKCSNQVKKLIENAGGQAIMWKTGHSLIKDKMTETNALLAGEMSGHIFYHDKWFGFDDGVYTGARLLEILANTSKTSQMIFAKIPETINTIELKIPMSDEIKFQFMDTIIEAAQFENAVLNTIDGLRVEFTYGWGLIRPSNTTADLILRFEADTLAYLNEIKKTIGEFLLKLDNSLQLPFSWQHDSNKC